MNTNRISSTDLKDRITQHIQELAVATDAARVSQEMLQYLDMCARFHRYSPQNVWLILMACPHATMVAGFKKWQSMERHVRKGEKGIPILAPIFKKVENEEGEEIEKLIGFKVVYVFDISQTDGEPLPGPPDWKSREKNAELTEHLIDFARSNDITIEVKDLPGDTQGASCGGKILLDPEAGTKTLIHEIAHEMLHQVKNGPTDRTVQELEAESVAYVVGKHFGLDGLSSPNYVALHGATAEMILDHVERIRKTATEIINGVSIE
ncbi:ArdC family protein [Chloroflexota bacterium]